MTDYSTLSDIELCERIAIAKGWTHFFIRQHKLFKTESGLEVNAKVILTWEYAGRLLEELGAHSQTLVVYRELGTWYIDGEHVNCIGSNEKLTRAICEAWLAQNESIHVLHK